MRTDAFDKIRQKSYLTPKQYKSGKPGLTGRHRLARSVTALTVQAYKLAKKADYYSADGRYAQDLYDALRAFVTKAQPLVDVE